MPSGAKKRKAAKKKLQKEAHNTNNEDGSHLQGIENDRPHDERESDGGEGERDSFEGHVVNNHGEGGEGGSLGEQSVAKFSKEVKSEEKYNDVTVNSEDDVKEVKNGKHKSSSSSSSSSDDDEVTVEKEKPVVEEQQQVQSSLSEASPENPVISEFVYSLVEESIPVEESVKQVVSLPLEANSGTETAVVENSMISHVIESGMKSLDEVSPSEDEKDKASSGVRNFVQEKVETKVIQVVEEGTEKLSESVDLTARNSEGLLAQSSGVLSADAGSGDNHVKESETHRYIEEQPLVSAPLPVRRTSMMSCCGLFEVFSGGASR